MIEKSYNLANNEIKAVNTLYGIIMGIMADNIITDDEINFLNIWLLDNKDFCTTFPLNVIRNQVVKILADGIFTNDERQHLQETLKSIIGGTFKETGAAGGISTTFGMDYPDNIAISGSKFCLTGNFVSGTREKCESSIKKFGGIPSKTVTKDLSFLVVGTLASNDWIATGHGRKIEKAIHYKDKGSYILIISEETLIKHISVHDKN
jgi:NAD-dependent DNA ligase